MEWAYKGLMGGYSVWTEGDGKHAPTHVILSDEEYQEMQEKIRSARVVAEKAKSLQYQAEDKMREEVERIEAEAERRIAEDREEVTAEIEQARSDKESAERLNRELLMIMKNRANAKRGIRPKKKHDGFVVLRSEEFDFGFQRDRKTRETLTLWRTTVQTPVDIGISAREAKKTIEKAFIEKVWPGLTVQNIVHRSGKSLSESIREIPAGTWETMDYILDIKYRQDTRTHLWEISYVHNRPLCISEDLYAER